MAERRGEEFPHPREAERPDHHDDAEDDVPEHRDRCLGDRVRRHGVRGRVVAQRDDVDRLRLAEAARRELEEAGKNV